MVAPALMLGAVAQPAPEPAPEAPIPYTLPSMAPAGAGPGGNAAITTAWTRSGHADAGSESFAHWNEGGAIPGICATCHSGQGFRALYGLDGSAPGVPEHALPTGGVVDCATCHHPRLSEVTEVRLPTGAMHPVGASEATCLTCHQGRASGQGVDAAVERAGSTGDDTPNPELGFVNPHYAIAAATWLGGYGGLGYQYPGKDYEGRFLHAPAVATCTSCHDPHGLQVAQDTCLTCHQSGDPKAIRITRQSHDGSGDTAKGIHADIAANARLLLEMVADYAAEVSGTPILYDALRHPYFFADANGDGVADQSGGAPVAYGAWTPRLLRAAYNWKFVGADTGAHVHNPHYALELLYDSIEDLSGALGRDFGALGLVR
ncbi:cytochrome c3 family protein [Paracoccus sp. Z118]|nr:cytochrome c3 family protein [Paracoccus sp. Z118]